MPRDSIFSRVKDRLDLRAIVKLEGQRPHGDYVSGRCPFHDDNVASLLVYKDGWRCKAASCPRPSGSVLDWIAVVERGILSPTTKQILEIAKEFESSDPGDLKLNLPIPDRQRRPPKYIRYSGDDLNAQVRAYHDSLDKTALLYLSDRGFNRSFIDFKRYGYDGRAITIPIWEGVPGESEVLGIRFRTIVGEGPRYWGYNSSHLYNAYLLKLACKPKCIYVVYGEFDADLLLQWNVPAVSPTNGCGSFKSEWLDDVAQFTEIVFVPDKGEELAAYTDAAKFGIFGHVQVIPTSLSGKDVTEVWQQNSAHAWRKFLTSVFLVTDFNVLTSLE